MNALEIFRTRLARYLGIFRWLAADAIWRFRRTVLGSLAVSAASLAAQAAALAIVASYAQAFQDGTTFMLAGMPVDVRSSNLALMATAISVVALFGVSAFSQFRAATWLLNTCREYEIFCTKRAISLATRVLHATRPTAGFPVADDRTMAMIFGDARICGRGFHNVVRTIPAAMGFLVFTAVMFYFDLPLTVIVVVTLAAASMLLYRVGLLAAGGAMQMESSRYYGRAERRAIRDALSWGVAPWPENHPRLRSMFESGHVGRAVVARLQADTSQATGAFIGSVLAGAVLVVIILFKGVTIMQSGQGWGDLVVYLIVGRFALSHYMGLSQSITGLNRHYPRIARYFGLLDSVGDMAPANASVEAAARAAHLTMAVKPPAGRTRSVTLDPGRPAALIYPGGIDRFAVLRLAGAFANDGGAAGSIPLSPALAWVVPAKTPSHAISPRAFFGFPERFGRAELMRDLAPAGYTDDDTGKLPKDLGKDLNVRRWRALPPPVFAAIGLAAAARATRPLVLASGKSVAVAGDAVIRHFVGDRLADRTIVFGYSPQDAAVIGALGEDMVLISDGTAVVNHMTVDRLKENPAVLGSLPRGDVGGPAGDAIDDEEL